MSKKWTLKGEYDSGFWYEDENGEKSERFKYAKKYSNGFGMVLLKNDRWAYRDINGKLSEKYRNVWAYSNGFGLVELANRKFAYRDENGRLSEEYESAFVYSYGLGAVKLGNGRYAYRDVDGELSKEYREAYSYENGFGLVQLENGRWAYIDVNGKLSEEYEVAYSYEKGFGYVVLRNGKYAYYAYRDTDGNLFSEDEYNNINGFYEGKVDVYSLEDEVFANDKILASILKKLKSDAYRFIKLAQNQEQLETAKRYYLDAIEYVLSTARNIRMTDKQKKKEEEQERIKKQQEVKHWSATQDELLEELNLK